MSVPEVGDYRISGASWAALAHHCDTCDSPCKGFLRVRGRDPPSLLSRFTTEISAWWINQYLSHHKMVGGDLPI